MDIKRIASIFLALSLLSSCIIVDTPGFYSGYKKLSPEQREKVVFMGVDDKVCGIANDKRIYAITGSQLLDCLKDNDTSVVYFWSPNCHSDVCISLPAAQAYCSRKGYQLYIISEYYAPELTASQNINPSPLLAVNHRHYGTDYCISYVKRFTRDLTAGTKLSKEDKFHRFYYFKGPKLVRTSEGLWPANKI